MRLDEEEMRGLAAAVLHQAMRDAVLGTNVEFVDPDDPDDDGAPIPNARSFCLDLEGDHSRSREIWCDAAGVLSESFRREAIRRIAARQPPATAASIRASEHRTRVNA